MLTVNPPQVRADATATVTYQGQANRAITFSVLSGDGAITALSTHTDAGGKAVAKYTPGTPGTTAVIQVEVGV